MADTLDTPDTTDTTELDDLNRPDAFDRATYADWQDLVEAGGRRSVEALGREDDDGLRVEPFYAAEHVAGIAPGWPGFAPFVRGATALAAAAGGWEVRQAHWLDVRSLDAVARGVGDDLAGGATALAFGGDVVVGLAAVLGGVDLAGVAIHLEPSGDGVAAAEALAALWADRGIDGVVARGGFGLDPIGVVARRGDGEGAVTVDELDERVAKGAGAAARLAADWPGVAGMLVDVRPYHDAGATSGQCVAFALATGVAYLRALEAAGLDVAAGAGRLRFTWSLGADVFGGAALLRAARRAWSRVLEACGVPEAAQGMRSDVTTAWRMAAEQDPANNIVRATLAVVGAVLGGADAVVVRPHDAGADGASAGGRRIARNLQRVLMDEAQLNRVIDAAGGSFALEARTDDLARAAWGLFQVIERAGGMVAAVQGGLVAGWVAEAAAARGARLADGRRVVVGVNRFVGDAAEEAS